ncbi:uncharacterized protein LOC114268817 [Camellia sinensis]|uniref:uncharacterized protein LOC114268817 n=1 Tax=Camellia sinensis TaxID=4442 RepID=UPI001035AAC1|nr:uncharacterized protein LOC114268817 [Camellia sinensis]
MKKLEDQAKAAIKAQTNAEEKAKAAEAIRKVAESQKREAEEKMVQAEKELQEALATKETEIKDVDDKAYAQGMADVTDAYEQQDEALVRKSKDADGAKSLLQNEQALDLTQDEEGDEVNKDAAYVKESTDVTLADKNLDDTLAEIDAEVAANKATKMHTTKMAQEEAGAARVDPFGDDDAVELVEQYQTERQVERVEEPVRAKEMGSVGKKKRKVRRSEEKPALKRRKEMTVEETPMAQEAEE